MSSEFPVVSAVDRQYARDVAYNSHDDEFLVVYRNWWVGGLMDIAAQRIRASDGALLSWRNPASCPGTDLMAPRVAYNAANNDYLVVFGQEVACVGDAVGVLVSATMSTVSPLIPICTNSADQYGLTVAAGLEEFPVEWEHIGCGWAYTVETVDQLGDTWATAPGRWPVYQPPYVDVSMLDSRPNSRFYKLRAEWVPPDR